ncbi:hypothetical protein FHR32_007192 [Streptosporangium album]|uniref:Uncharacterized protein n=1 Tax=Streptosporangium album TaxID=47479 RepID=A0A7W7WCN3_9ACTN|nr:hypothetical protein [Streptosporangium album]MBB4942792.1 hypothetical protein [Streptosporangium album]
MLALLPGDLQQGLPGKPQTGHHLLDVLQPGGQLGDLGAQPVGFGVDVLFAFVQVPQQLIGHHRCGAGACRHAAKPSNDLDRQVVVAVPVSRRVMLSAIDQ